MEGKKRKKEEEKKDVNSSHYVIASSRPPERRPMERRTLVPTSFKYQLDIFTETQPNLTGAIGITT